MTHKAGFVNIIGKPNVGKSTLMNLLIGQKLSIITPKAQTTRHRILGIVNGEDYQVVFSDTPGILKPKYKLQQEMMEFVKETFIDADIIIFMTDVFDKGENLDEVQSALEKTKAPVLLVINKADLSNEAALKAKMSEWNKKIKYNEAIVISALHGFNIDKIWEFILQHLPESPPYFDKDALTDRHERFFVSEIIREKIFMNYREEIPYSTEVGIETFKEKDDITVIRAEIYVEKKSQKNIIIGKGGEAIKKVGIEARKDIEGFLGKKVFLELFVKVRENWRNNPNVLRTFGY